jgi:hypothetical protein
MNLKTFIASASSVHAGERVTTDSKGRIIPLLGVKHCSCHDLVTSAS